MKHTPGHHGSTRTTALRLAAAAILALGKLITAASAAEEAPVFEVARINAGLENPPDAPQRATPQATLDFFISAVRNRDFATAAHALDLAGTPAARQGEVGPRRARQLGYVLLTTNVVHWSEVPDTPDGRVRVRGGDGGALTDVLRRRAVRVGTMEADGRRIPLHLHRLENDDGDRVWLFSRATVAAVPALYEAQGPGALVSVVPKEWLWRVASDDQAWRLYAGAALVAVSAVAGGLVWLVTSVLGRLVFKERAVAKALGRSAGSFGVLAMLVTFGITTSRFLVLDSLGFNVVRMLTWLVVFLLGTMIAWRLLGAVVRAASLYFAPNDADEDRAMRGIKTHIAVAQRILLVVVIALGLGLLLLQLGVLSSLGLSIAVSTGLLTAVFLVAARPVFTSLVSAAQIAGTKPVEIGDVVILDDVWGRVEDIAFAFVVIRTWRNTRLIVPHDHLLSHPFENLSRRDDTVMHTIDLFVDYHTDIDAVRRRFEEIVEADERAGGTRYFTVSELRPQEVKLQAWVTGPSPTRAWHLHNDVREQLLQFVQSDAARLPRLRHEAVPARASGPRTDVARDPSPAREPDVANAEEGAS